MTEQSIRDGLKQVYLPGRQELISYQGKRILLDVAHNPAAVKQLAHKMESLAVKGKIYAITGWQKDKDIKSALSLIKDYIFDWNLISLPQPRGAQSDYLASILEALNVHRYSLKPLMDEALVYTLNRMFDEDLLVIFGSFVTVCEAYLNLRKMPL